jgi:hypothetical protein
MCRRRRNATKRTGLGYARSSFSRAPPVCGPSTISWYVPHARHNHTPLPCAYYKVKVAVSSRRRACRR